MRSVIGTIALAFVGSSLPNGVAAQAAAPVISARTDSVVIKELLELEKLLSRAELAADTLTLGARLHDSYVHTTHDGVLISRSERLAALARGKPRYSTASRDSIDVRVFGSTAIVTGRSHDAGTNANTSFDAYLRFTDTWIQFPEAWQLVASQKTQLRH
jgi:hypothetical protein